MSLVAPFASRLRVVVAGVLVLGAGVWPLEVDGTVVSSRSDPALAGATVHGLEGIEGVDEQSTLFAFTVANTIVTMSTTGTTGLLTCEFEDCWMDAPPEGITIAFDPPVAAAGIDLRYGPSAIHTVTFTGGTSDEVVHPDGGTFEAQRIDVLAAAADIGGISTMTLASDGFSRWDNLLIVPGAEPPGDADLVVAFTQAPSSVSYGASFGLELELADGGPDTAQSASATVLLYPGTEVTGATPAGSPVTSGRRWDVGDLANGGVETLSLQARSPNTVAFSCDGAMLSVAVARAETGDPNRRNNVAVAVTPFSASGAAAAEDCARRGVDEDCDERFDCADDDCAEGAACAFELADLGRDTAPDEPPLPPETQPAGEVGCQNTNMHGELVNRPAICCGGRPCDACVDPSVADWSFSCPPLDPNYKEADPPTNGLGYGQTAAGQVIAYGITYENIGGSDAHDVLILDVLDSDVDDNTLAIEDDGTYDPAMRTLTWLDPVLPPNTPRTVHYSVAVDADAAPGTRVRNVATIVFPDAFPPTRIDTPLLEHVIPTPTGQADEPDLLVAGCAPAGSANEWTVRLVNRGRAFAYNVTAEIGETPAGFAVTDGLAAFAHPTDVDPEVLSCVIPWATTTSRDTIAVGLPADWPAGADPCSVLSWVVEYHTIDGQTHTLTLAAEDFLNGDDDMDADTAGDAEGTDGSDGGAEAGGGGDSGCGCRVVPKSAAFGWLIALALLGSRRSSRRRRARLPRARPLGAGSRPE